ncbi:MAG: hypothetical protein HRT99_03840 [Mycoplasmatales bacterium]|nr:hypothetical protein [Mycoplasmatales bacterium]
MFKWQISNNIFANGYKKVVYDLSNLDNKVMSSFGVAFRSGHIDVKIGQMKFVPYGIQKTKQVEITSLKGEGKWVTTNGNNVRINMKIANPQKIKMYLIYLVENGVRKLLNVSNSSSFLLKYNNTNNSDISKFEIVPVTSSLDRLIPIKINIS